jgi:processive 1,2-diacylglycerol beta-glucosyltransferase
MTSETLAGGSSDQSRERALALVAYASVGSGHESAAQAVGAALQTRSGGEVETRLVDALDFGGARRIIQKSPYLVDGVGGHIYHALWSSFVPARSASTIGAFVSFMYRNLGRMVAAARPALVIATHALPAIVTARMRLRSRTDASLLTVATDMGVHSWWPAGGVDMYCIASDAARRTLEARGIPSGRIESTGIPLRPQFAEDLGGDSPRLELGVAEDDLLVLVLAGASHRGPYARLKAMLPEILPGAADLHGTSIVVVTGKDEVLRGELQAMVDLHELENVSVLGYVDAMARLMATSDVLLTKAGGLTTTEALAVGLPMILVGPSFGQERSNELILESEGAAQLALTSSGVNAVLRALAREHDTLARMRECAHALHRPDAAKRVADRALQLLREGGWNE